jgi:hypothetical protein
MSGSNLELSDRLACFLSMGLPPSTSCKSKQRAPMPKQLALESGISNECDLNETQASHELLA